MSDPVPSISCDVAVIGGGLAGKAASLHLARAGMKVVCIEPQQAVRPPVGESLDWSAPALLCTLGLSQEKLLESRIATWKRHVTLKIFMGAETAASQGHSDNPTLANEFIFDWIADRLESNVGSNP